MDGCMTSWLGSVLSMGRHSRVACGVAARGGGFAEVSSPAEQGSSERCFWSCIRRCWMRRFIRVELVCGWWGRWWMGSAAVFLQWRGVVRGRVRRRCGCFCRDRGRRSLWSREMRMAGLSRRWIRWWYVRSPRSSWVVLVVFVVIRCSGWSGRMSGLASVGLSWRDWWCWAARVRSWLRLSWSAGCSVAVHVQDLESLGAACVDGGPSARGGGLRRRGAQRWRGASVIVWRDGCVGRVALGVLGLVQGWVLG